MAAATLPEYVSSEQKDREAFLSQLGTFSPGERELFHRLCKMWTGQISCGYIVSMTEHDLPNVKSDLDSLMGKLRRQRVGIMRTNLADGQRSPAHVILCNRDDAIFYLNLVDEMLLDVVGDINAALPSVETLNEAGITLPPDIARPGDFAALAKLYNDKTPRDPELFRLPCPKAPQEFLLASTSIKRFLTVSLAKLQVFFQNANFLAAVAQLRGSSVMELRKALDSKDPVFWHELATFILAVNKDLANMRKLTLDPQLFQICHFLKQFLNEQMAEQKRRRDAEQEKATDIKAICERVRSVVSIVMNEQDFSETLLFYKPKYQNDFAAFKEMFQKTCMEAATGKNLTVISRIGNGFIHMDNIHPWLIQQINRYSKDLLAVYVREMESFVKHPNDGGYEFFYSPASFQEDISLRLRESSPALADLLDRPNLVAEAIIHSARRQKDVRNPEEMKALLSPYLHTDRIRFRALSQILGLKVQEIYRLAYMRLSILRQLILRFSGRHDSFLRKFDSFVLDDDLSLMGSAEEGSERLSSADRARERREREERRQKTSAKTGKAGKDVKNSKPGVKPAAAKGPRQYTVQERDSAWTEFSRSIKK